MAHPRAVNVSGRSGTEDMPNTAQKLLNLILFVLIVRAPGVGAHQQLATSIAPIGRVLSRNVHGTGVYQDVHWSTMKIKDEVKKLFFERVII